MMLAVNVVVTCSSRKSVAGGPRLRDCRAANLEKRAAQWCKKLESSTAPLAPAVDLYAGEHWSVARSLPGIAREGGLKVALWVCSAGYGLVEASSHIRPYHATFAGGHPDSVLGSDLKVRDSVVRERWWDALSRWNGPSPGRPRSLAELVRREPLHAVVVAASGPYLQAMASDLRTAQKGLAPGTPLIVVTCDKGMALALEDITVRCDARLQVACGGSRISLATRALRLLLAGGRKAMTVAAWRDRIGLLSQHRRDGETVRRVRMTDGEVRSFVSSELRMNPRMSVSALLRKLRDGGNACEQTRFGKLFSEVRAEGGA